MKHLFIFACLVLLTIQLSAQISYNKNLKRSYNNRSYYRKTTILTFSLGVRSWYKNNITKADSFSSPTISESITPVYLKVERTLSNSFGLGMYIAYSRFGYFYYSPHTTATFNNTILVGSAGITAYYHFNKIVPVNYLDIYIAAGAGINYVQHKYSNEYNNFTTIVEPPQTSSADITPVLCIGARYYVDRHSAIVAEGGYDKLSLLNLGVSYRF